MWESSVAVPSIIPMYLGSSNAKLDDTKITASFGGKLFMKLNMEISKGFIFSLVMFTVVGVGFYLQNERINYLSSRCSAADSQYYTLLQAHDKLVAEHDKLIVDLGVFENNVHRMPGWSWR